MNISKIINNLPIRDYTDSTGHYGAAKIVNQFCNTNKEYKIPGLWQHGPFPFNEEFLLEKMPVITDEELHIYARSSWKYFVAREDMRDILKQNGYKHVFDIGLPFLYLPELDIFEIKDSVLFFPQHTGVSEAPLDFTIYSETLKVLKASFKHVGICVHANDYSKNIIEKLLSVGFDFAVVGSDEHDANSLYRIKYLISHFEYIISDTFSSAVAYGAYLNKRIAIVTDAFEGQKSLLELKYYEELAFLHLSISKVRNAERHKRWGENILGQLSKKSSSELQELFYFNSFNELNYLYWYFQNRVSYFYNNIFAFQCARRDLNP